MNESQESIQLLVISYCTLHCIESSDIHKKVAFNAFLNSINAENMKEQFDYILDAGDIVFLTHKDDQSAEDVDEMNKTYTYINQHLESFNIPHVMVPGNHDPSSDYDQKTPKIINKLSATTNLHNLCYQMRPHLWIVGFGGSIPYGNASGSIRHDGYPFTNSDIGNEVEELLSLIPKGDQVILLTHNPPAHVGSSFMDLHKKDDAIIMYGSQRLYDCICNSLSSYDILLCIHGHVHHEPGTNWIHRNRRSCCIVNPGSVMGGRYAQITLSKHGDRWKVTSVHHYFEDL